MKTPNPKPHPPKFEDVARELGCDEDEVRFNVALGKIARHKPQVDPPKPAKEPKTKNPAE